LRKIAQKRMLEIVDLAPEELRQVEEAEKQIEQAVKDQQEEGIKGMKTMGERVEGGVGQAPAEQPQLVGATPQISFK